MIIAGSGRSGTTWVLDVLARTFRLRPIFEPLHPGAIKGAKAYAWKHVAPGGDLAGMDAFFREIFTGDISSCWTDLRFHPAELIPPPDFFRRTESAKLMLHRWINAFDHYRTYAPLRARSRIIVKFIRANLLLGWLAQHFDARVLLLVRHPGAVVESKLRLGGFSWDPGRLLDVYRQDETIHHLRGGVYRDLLSRELTSAQALALHWCIENQLPIAEAKQNGYLLVHYEDLVERGGPVWDRIAQFFDLSSGGWDQDLLSRPSQQASATWRDNELAIDSHQSWRHRIQTKDLEDIQSILTETDETLYSAYEPLPRTATAT
ncbi:sulfotransferase [Thiocapsa marina]|nr:sulfotransferase [Thiocapsa marina]